MSDNYHYEEGAIHYDHKKVLHIGNVGSGDIGKVISAFFKADAEVVEEVKCTEEPDVNQQQPLLNDKTTLSASRQEILEQLLTLVGKGDWKYDRTADEVKQMLLTVLGQGETTLTGKEAAQSDRLWHLLENGRSDRVKIVWQNIVGFLDDRKLLMPKGSPALNKDFFGKEEGYPNIDKGRPSRDNMSAGFQDVLPLLDKYCPKMDKKA